MNKLPLCPLGLLLLLVPASTAQDAPFHADMRDSFKQAGRSYSDVWGDQSEGYIGRFGNNQIDIIDLANPDNLSLAQNIVIPSPNNGCSAQDIKVGPSAMDPSKTLAFISFESSGPDAVGIYDVTNPSSPNLLTRVQPSSSLYQTSHNTIYREDGWLVIVNSFSSDASIIDLRTYNPSSPPSTITSSTYLLSNLGSGFVHDVAITDDYLFLAEWDSLQVWDVSDLGSGPPTFLGQVRGYSCHAVWPSDDAAYIVTTEERSGGAVRLYKMTDNGSSITLKQTDSYVAPKSGAGQSYSAHNPLFFEDRIFTSFYGAGVVVHQIDRTDGTFERVASYDTSSSGSSGFNGCWGVYPFFGYDNVLASDQSNGLFTLDFSGIEFRSASTRPRTLTPFTPTPIQVFIEGLGNMSVNGSTAKLFTRVDGGAFTSSNLTSLGGDLWQGTLPSIGCGAKLDYYFSAAETGGEGFTRPANAPSEFYTAYGSLSMTTLFSDNFNSNMGWSVTNDPSLSSGQWERGVPVETGIAPGYDDPADSGNNCYSTENGPNGGSTSNEDVDGGPTRLISPTLDFSSGDGLISFTAWQACTEPDALDALTVDISNNGGAGGSWVTAMSIVDKSGGWIRYSFRVSDFVTPNNNVKVRFLIQDNPNDSVTEGAVDNFVAESFCSSNLALASFSNGGGSNTTCFSTTPPVLGQNWVSTVTHSGHPGASLTMIVLYQDASSGTFGPGGELLVDLSSTRYFQSLKPTTGSTNTHTHFVPADVSFAGRTTAAQGLILGGVGGYELCNGYSLEVGF